MVSNSVSLPSYRALEWQGDELTGSLKLIDQTVLPTQLKHIDGNTVELIWEAIKQLKVRGAPAIGVAAAYGIVVGLQPLFQPGAEVSREEFDRQLARVAKYLAESRPTAVNLFWAIQRMEQVAKDHPQCSAADLQQRLLLEAQAIETEDRAMCARLGEFGASLLPANTGILTHCNTGGLATAGDGTAFAALAHAHAAGKQIHVYADETRPLLQGARLTMWELMQRGIPCTLITDSMAGQVMKEGRIGAAIIGADRITARGDAANKIGTYSVAVLCHYHKIPFYVSAPSSTFDLTLLEGKSIPIEERVSTEITHPGGVQLAPTGANVYNPAFDFAPAELITAIITEKGIIQPVTEANVRKVLGA
ncbi:S-methyl-5-thioribose-1-phosphate isomerase [Planctopirus hydrillae]|uniref:S-methyl-5-thioribose-1-phosphate isomerase n=1 Tax=Planctopirus hydrillae TaxID=1841610 RepID=UPI000AE8E00A|nr:S-methyl-5-thioribose-1-phosphate isomerase [Planctopirus hydrillae]